MFAGSGTSGYRGRGFEPPFRGNNRGSFQHKKLNGRNPVINGYVTRCKICDSTFDHAKSCPHGSQSVNLSESNTTKSCNNEEGEGFDAHESVNIILMNEVPLDKQYEVFFAEADLAAIIDTACFKTACGSSWLSVFTDQFSLESVIW